MLSIEKIFIVCISCLIASSGVAIAVETGWDHSIVLSETTPVMPSPLTNTTGGLTWIFSSSTADNAWYIKGEIKTDDVQADIGDTQSGTFSVIEEWKYLPSTDSPPDSTFEVSFAATIPGILCQSKKWNSDDAAAAEFRAECSIAVNKDEFFEDSDENWAIASVRAVELKDEATESDVTKRKGINVSAHCKVQPGTAKSWKDLLGNIIDVLAFTIEMNWSTESLSTFVKAENDGSDNVSENWIESEVISECDLVKGQKFKATLKLHLNTLISGANGDAHNWYDAQDSKAKGELNCTTFALDVY